MRSLLLLTFIWSTLICFCSSQDKSDLEIDFETKSLNKWNPVDVKTQFIQFNELYPTLTSTSYPQNQNFLKVKFRSLLDSQFKLQIPDKYNSLGYPELCLHFSYLNWDPDATLSTHIYVIQHTKDGEQAVLWISPATMYDVFQMGIVCLSPPYKEIYFSAGSSEIIFARLLIDNSACPLKTMCDFESGQLCHFKKVPENSLLFSRVVAESKKQELVSIDATSFATSGHYLAMNSHTTPLSGSLNWKVNFLPGLYQISFDFFEKSPTSNSLFVLIYNEINGNIRTVWDSTMHPKIDYGKMLQWEKVQIAVFLYLNEYVQFHGNQIESPSIAIDNFKITPYPSYGDGCSFNRNYCLYRVIENHLASVSFGLRPYLGAHNSYLDKEYQKYHDEIDQAPFLRFDFTESVPKSDLIRKITLTGPVITCKTPSVEIYFEYFVWAPQPKKPVTFEIFIITKNREKLVYAQNSQTKSWIKEKIVVTDLYEFRILLRASVVIDDTFGIVGLRNLHVHAVERGQVDEKPIDSLSCPFTTDFCGWYHEQSWSINNEMVEPYPPYYINNQRIYKFALFQNSQLKSTQIESPEHFPINTEFELAYCTCFSWYTEDKNEHSFFYLYKYPGPSEGTTILYQTKVSIFDHKYKRVCVDFNQKGKFRLLLRFEIISRHIALTDFQTYQGLCHALQSEDVLCDFETKDCDFVSLYNSIFYRTIASDVSSTAIDHTLKSKLGHFLSLYKIEYPTIASQKFAIPKIKVVSCLRIWMNINANAYLTAKLNDFVFISKSYFKKLDDWFVFEFDLKPEFGRLILEVIFEVTLKGSDYIAFDDIHLSKGECKNLYKCNLEEECFWEASYKELQWTDSQGNTFEVTPEADQNWEILLAARSKSPTVDATLQTNFGHFWQTNNGFSILKSPAFHLELANYGQTFCLYFDYYTKSDFERVFILVSSKSFNEIKFSYEITLKSTDVWTHFQKEIDMKLLTTKQFEIFTLFIVLDQQRDAHKLSIDNLNIDFQKCPPNPTHFECKDASRTVIETSKVCDQEVDCLNGLDEKNCGQCSFESDFCDYTYIGENDVKFTISTSRENTAEFSSKEKSINNFQLKSPLIRETYSRCTFSFQYVNTFKFSLWILKEELMHNLWNSPSEISDYETVNIDLKSIKEPFSLIFNFDSKDYKQSTSETKLVNLSNLKMNKCVKFALLNEDFPNEEFFQCGAGIGAISESKVCDWVNDCDNYKDELNCAFDKYRNNFESLPITSFMITGFNFEQNYLSIKNGPTVDHTHAKNCNQFLIVRLPSQTDSNDFTDALSNNQMILSSDNYWTAKMFGFYLFNGLNCAARFAIFVNSDKARIRLCTLNLRSSAHFCRTEELKKHLQWELKSYVINSMKDQRYHQMRLTIEVQLSSQAETTDYVALDNLSFSTKCFPKIGLQNNFLVQFGGFTMSEDWFIKQVPHLSITRKEDTKYSSGIIIKYVGSIKDEDETEKLEILSPIFMISSDKDLNLEFRYKVNGPYVQDLSLWDHQVGLIWKHSKSENIKNLVYFLTVPIVLPPGIDHLQLTIRANVIGEKSQIILNEIRKKVGEKSLPSICSFENSQCHFFKEKKWHSLLTPEKASTYGFIDHTTGTSFGKVLIGRSEVNQKQHLFFHLKSTKSPKILSFWVNFKGSSTELTKSLILIKDDFGHFPTLYYDVNLFNGWNLISVNLHSKLMLIPKVAFLLKEDNTLIAVDDLVYVNSFYKHSASEFVLPELSWFNPEREHNQALFACSKTFELADLPLYRKSKNQQLTWTGFNARLDKYQAELWSAVMVFPPSTCLIMKYILNGTDENPIELSIWSNDGQENYLLTNAFEHQYLIYRSISLPLPQSRKNYAQQIQIVVSLAKHQPSADTWFVIEQLEVDKCDSTFTYSTTAFTTEPTLGSTQKTTAASLDDDDEDGLNKFYYSFLIIFAILFIAISVLVYLKKLNYFKRLY